jgi:hypothetical protein
MRNISVVPGKVSVWIRKKLVQANRKGHVPCRISRTVIRANISAVASTITVIAICIQAM